MNIPKRVGVGGMAVVFGALLAAVLQAPLGVAAAPSGSPGCVRKAPPIGEHILSALDGNEKARQYTLWVPRNYSNARGYPLVFVFHGAGGSAAKSYAWGLQNAAGAADSAIFVFPNGMQFKKDGIGWDDSKTGYDMPFFDNMLNSVEAHYCVDTQRVFAAGFSWGGDFVVALSCARGEVLRAVAVNSATDEYKKSDDSATYANLPCPSRIHPAVRFEHASNGDAAYPAPLFATTAGLYRQFNGCDAASKPVASSVNGMRCVAYEGCAKQFIECAFPSSLGHALPPNWAEDTWAFFDTFK